MSDPPPSLAEARPDLPAELDELIKRGMAKDPDERFASPGELMRAVAEVLGTPTAETSAARAAIDDGQATRPAAPVPGDPTVARHAMTAAGETAPETARATRPQPAQSSRALVAAGAAALVVAVVAGFMVGGSGSDSGSEGADFANSASAGSIVVSHPADWARADTPRLPGVRFSHSMTLAPDGESGRTLTTGMTTTADATLLPRSFLRRLPREPEAQLFGPASSRPTGMRTCVRAVSTTA